MCYNDITDNNSASTWLVNIMKKQTDIISTYALSLINDWSSISEIIIQHSQNELKKNKGETSDSATPEQINSSLSGPYSTFIKQHLNAYGTILKFRTALIIKNNKNIQEELKQSETGQQKNQDINPEKLGELSESILDDMTKNLGKLAKEQNSEWKNFYEEQTNEIIQFLAKKNIKLTATEINEFKHHETADTIFNDYKEKNIDLPKNITSANSFHNYLLLRTKTAILNSLSRQQTENKENALKNTLKELKTTLKKINSSEKEKNTSQKKSIDEIIHLLL